MKQTQGEYDKMAKAIIKVAKEKTDSGISFSSDEKSFKNELANVLQIGDVKALRNVDS